MKKKPPIVKISTPGCDLVDLGAVQDGILRALNAKLESTAKSVRQELANNVEVLRGCLTAADELLPRVKDTKPDYVQVWECILRDTNYFGADEGRNCPMKLPFTEMRGYHQNQCADLSQGASDTVRAVAQALSGRQGDNLDGGRYRYAILLFKVEEPPAKKE